MTSAQPCVIPKDTLLGMYARSGAFTDCFAIDVDRQVTQREFVEAFYTSSLFKVERWLLAKLLSRPSTDSEVHALAEGRLNAFAVWSVEQYKSDQILLAAGSTRSWLMTFPVESSTPGTRLYFGSAVLPNRSSGFKQLTWGGSSEHCLDLQSLFPSSPYGILAKAPAVNSVEHVNETKLLRRTCTTRGLMTKPLINLDNVQFDDIEDHGFYTSRRALFSAGIGARKLGYNLTELPPGKAQCPFHSHREEEEMFLILEGEGELRFGQQKFKLRRFDVVACPTGGAEVAHQIINTGTTPMRYLSLSSVAETEVCEYPDSRKIGIFASTSSASGVRKMFRAETGVDYYDRESTDPPTGDT